MNGLPDPLGYESLPGWSQFVDRQRTIKPMVVPVSGLPKWQSVALGFAAGGAVLFFTQFMLAIASGDLKGYRARSLDVASAASVAASVAGGIWIWRKTND